MSTIRIAALSAVLAMAVSAFAQDPVPAEPTPPSTIEQDKAKAEAQAADMLGDPDVHWSIKERMELLMYAPFMRPRDQWELMHMFLVVSSNEERVIREAVTNAIRRSGMAFAQRMAVRTTTTTTTITEPGEPTVVRQQETVTVVPDVRAQQIGAGFAIRRAISSEEAYALLERDLDAPDRGAFRNVWDGMTSAQRDALVNSVQNAVLYYDYRMSRGY